MQDKRVRIPSQTIHELREQNNDYNTFCFGVTKMPTLANGVKSS